MHRSILFTAAALQCIALQAQLGAVQVKYTKEDSLRGSIGPYRAWWDVVQYDVSVRPNYEERSITGSTTIAFDAVADGQRMQIDFQQPLVMDKVMTEVVVYENGSLVVKDQSVPFTHEGNVVWVDLPSPMVKGNASTITFHYHGVPRAAVRPPWDGGWIWKKDSKGNPWMSVACQGLGASVWYPCKDHQSDEPDRGASLHITVPDSLVAVGNGRLRSTVKNDDGTSTWNWMVINPINTYNLVPYIGKYAHWSEVFDGAAGKLDCDHWVLAHNEAKAREQFKQVAPMLECFEEWFGPFPFYEDGYKLVEAPHLGMEHQSAIAYGNGYQNGYLGTDRSGSGRGLSWDYIIIHESAHEWFGNSITTGDIADMWFHEGFACYSETVYTECQQGKEAGEDYVVGLRPAIRNDRPMIGPYGVNEEGSGDMYTKGANLIHMIRHIVGDSTFKVMLLEMNKRFYRKTVTSAEIEDFMINFNERTNRLLNESIFEQYLRTTQVPTLEWGVYKKKLWMRWGNCVNGFALPMNITIGEQEWEVRVWGEYHVVREGVRGNVEVEVDRNWYVSSQRKTKKEVKAANPKQYRTIGVPPF